MHSAWAAACENLPARADLYAEDGLAHLTLGAEEILVAVLLPPDPRPSNSAKTPVRGVIDFPPAGVAVALAAENGHVVTLCLGPTGTNLRPILRRVIRRARLIKINERCGPRG